MAKKGGKQKRTNRRRVAGNVFDAIAIEGALIQPDMFAAIAAGEATEQAEADYGLDPKEKLRDVVQTKFTLAQSLYARLLGSDRGPAATRRFISSFVTQVFEFGDLAEAEPVRIGDRAFAIGHQALRERVPVVLAPYGKLEEPTQPFGDGGRRRSAGQLLQEYLNAADSSLWGIACDGVRLRLCRDSAALTRPAFIEADLSRIFDADAPLIADFAALWLLVHVSRFGRVGSAPSDCALEHWREEGRKQGATARERLRDGVESALLVLGRGFLEHPANASLRAELTDGRLSPQAYLQALLRLVYRFIFVFTAEDRDVLHLPPPEDKAAYEEWRRTRVLYQRGYGFSRFRERAARRLVRDRHGDGWEGVQIVFRALARGEARLALPALGGLFGPNGARELGDCALSNARLYEALFNLTWLSTEAGLERVNWRDMQTEELGSVYESLLELSPQMGGPEGFEFIAVSGNERKTTASYYTPDSLVQALLDETLDPLIEETVKDKKPDDAAEALLSLRIIDPACGSGHFLLAAARRIAAKVSELKCPGAASPAEFRHWLRECARRCLFGVDRNPMAVDLAKVALWIETVEPGKPLTFFDAHIRCGDALLGIYDFSALEKGISDDAYKALTGDDRAAAREWAKRNKAEREARTKGQLPISEPPEAFRDALLAIETGGEDALSDVEAKTRAFHDLLAGPDRYALQVACDLYMAAFLLPKVAPPGRHAGEAQSFVPASRDVWERLSGRQISGQVEAHAVDAARQARAFHWPLEFPQVFFPEGDRHAGFDLAIGNPPWERIKLQEKEYFASRAPEIAEAPNKAARQQKIDLLAKSPPDTADGRLYASFILAKRLADAASTFSRVPVEFGGRFPLCGTGDINTYALFAELFSKIGRWSGAVLPLGIGTADTCSTYFSSVVSSKRLRSLISFAEIKAWFPGSADNQSFCLFCLGRAEEMRFAFRLEKPADLQDARRLILLTASDISIFNPNTHTSPIFRSTADAELSRFIYTRHPVLIHESKGAQGNPWGIEFARMFDMSGDSELFRTASQLNAAAAVQEGVVWNVSERFPSPGVSLGRWLPLYEAKMLSHFDHRFGSYPPGHIEDTRALPRPTPQQQSDPDYDPNPRYWVAEAQVAERLKAKGWSREWLIGWRDITNVTNERTVIAAALPWAGVGDKFLLMLPDVEPPLICVLLAALSSLTFDYIARQKLGGTSLKYFIMKQLVVPAPTDFSEILSFVVPRVIELTYTSNSMRPFASDLCYSGSPFGWDESRRGRLRAELDAKIAKLYGLDRDQLRYILDPEDVMGKGYPSETFRVLKKNDMDKYGEYRTARLVLEAWDRLERGELE